MFPLPCFLERCVDKLTQTPVIFTPGMQRARERDRGYREERELRKRERTRWGRGWDEMTTDTDSREAE